MYYGYGLCNVIVICNLQPTFTLVVRIVDIIIIFNVMFIGLVIQTNYQMLGNFYEQLLQFFHKENLIPSLHKIK